MKIYLILIIAALLSACNTTSIVTKTRYIAVEIPSELLDCDLKSVSIPDPKKLKNRDVIVYINKLEKLVTECKSDVSGIKKIIIEYKKAVEKLNSEEK